MAELETISPKEAAILARVHSTAIYRAVESGHVHVIRSSGRLRILRRSFENWRQRLETRRKLRREEEESVAQ